MSEQFNPKAAVKSIRRGSGSFQYMQVKDRILWFRKDNPEGVVQAELVRWDAEAGVAVVLATVSAPGLGLAQGLGSACRADLADKASRKAVQPDQVESYVEFAETAAVGRALGRLGYGTEDALDVTPVDSPHDTGAQNAPQQRERAAATQQRSEAAPSTLSAADSATIRNAVAALGWGAPDCSAYLKQYGVTRFGELTPDQAAEVIPDLLSKAAEIEAA